MKKNEFMEIKKMDFVALNNQVSKLKSEIAKLVLDKSIKKLTNLREIRNKRRDLAQIMTVLRQKQMIKVLEESHAK